MKTTPTKKEIAIVRKVIRDIQKLRYYEEDLCRKLAEKYIPCKVGDIVEGGKTHREQGRVIACRCYVWEDGYSFRVSYYPLRGKKELKHYRTFNFMDTIKVIRKA